MPAAISMRWDAMGAVQGGGSDSAGLGVAVADDIKEAALRQLRGFPAGM
jgi:hypothetical protein